MYLVLVLLDIGYDEYLILDIQIYFDVNLGVLRVIINIKLQIQSSSKRNEKQSSRLDF